MDGFLFFSLVIALGYLTVRLKLVPEEAVDVLPSVLLNVCFPAMVLTTFAETDASQLFSTALSTVLVSLVFSLVPFFLGFVLFRKMKADIAMQLRYLVGIGNTSFVCIPLLSQFLSDELMIIVFVHGAVLDFLIWGVHHQIFLGSGERNPKLLLKKVVCTPSLICLAVGIILSAFRLSLPSFLQYTADALSAAVSPVALLFIGMLMCRYGLFSWRKDRPAIFYSIWKVLLYPIVVFAVVQCFLPLPQAIVLAILFGSPAPVTLVVWCKQYGRDPRFSVDCLIPSTVLYLFVMGVVLLLLTHFGVLY